MERAFPAMPYKGLMPYAEEDAPFFFGRDADSQTIISNLMASRLTLLVGASGVGKSSVLLAGAAHKLKRLARENYDENGMPELAVAVFKDWRDDPIVGLTSRIQDSVAQALNIPSVEPSQNGRSLSDALEKWAELVGGDLLIILDQFEEYFLYHAQEDGEGTFAVEFPRIVNRPGLRVNFLIALRDDSLSKLDRFQGSIPAGFDNYLRVDHLDSGAAREAIEKPIELFNRLYAAGRKRIDIQPDLVDAVLDQLRTGKVLIGEAGGGVIKEEVTATSKEAYIETPYLQLVMTRLWEEEMEADSRVLRLETLERLGGAESIVRTHLDKVMKTISANEREIAARMFYHLVTPSGSKIAYIASDLANLAGSDQAQLRTVLDKLSSQSIRILRPIPPPMSGVSEPRYEIFHDVLARAILDWRARYAVGREHRRVSRWRLGAIGLALVLMFVILLFAYAIKQKNIAEEEKKKAQAQEFVSKAISLLSIDPAESLRLATEAAGRTRTPDTEYILRRSFFESRMQALMKGHGDYVKSATFSTNGKFVVTASRDNTARVWEASTGRQVVKLEGHAESVNSAVFSPDGKYVLTASDDYTARVWEASTGKPKAELNHSDFVTSATFSPDGKFVVTASYDQTARVWDSSTGQVTAVLGHEDFVNNAIFSPDGKFVLTTSNDKMAKVWKVGTWQMLARLKAHSDLVTAAAFSRDSNLVATAGADRDRTVRIWEMNTWKRVAELKGHDKGINSVAFSPNGEHVVTASRDTTARLWSSRTGEQEADLHKHTGWVNTAEFSPDGKHVVTASEDGTAILCDANTMIPLITLLGHEKAAKRAVFNPDGNLVVTTSDDNTARVWDVSPERNLASIILRNEGDVVSAAFSPDGNLVITTGHDDAARLWEASTGRKIMELSGSVNDAAFSLDGKLIVTASSKTARVLELRTRTQVELTGHAANVNTAMFSPNSSLVVTSSNDKTARLWEASTGRQVGVLEGHTESVTSAMFSPDGKRVVTASNDKTARLWEVGTWSQLAELGGHTGSVTSAMFSPDGKMAVTASSNDKTAKVWDASSGEKKWELPGQTDYIRNAIFSPDGQLILTLGYNSARVWEASSGKHVAELRGHTETISSATFSPDGVLVITASTDNTAKIWQLSSGRVVAELRGHSDKVNSARLSPDGKFVITGGRDKTARIHLCQVCLPIDDLLKEARGRFPN